MELKNDGLVAETVFLSNGWELLKVSDTCNLINGRGFKPYEWKSEGLPIIRIQNLNGSDEYNYFDGNYDKKLEVESGQLLFAWSGSRGTSFGPHLWKGRMGLLNYHTWKVVINESVVDREYLFYALKKLTKYIEDNAHGASALVHVQKWEMEKFRFPCPKKKSEQVAIARILSDTDALITSLEKLIEKKQAIKQGVMQELLRPKKGWAIKKLVDVVDYIHGKAHEREIVEDGKYIVVNSKTVSTEGRVVKYSNVNYCPARSNDILTVLSDLPNGKALAKCFYVSEEDKYAVNQRVCIWRSKGAYPRFLYYILNRNKYFLALNDGVSQTHILNHHIEKCEIAIPDNYEEQQRIASILSAIDNELASLELIRSKYAYVKQGMMQELLTGKARLL